MSRNFDPSGVTDLNHILDSPDPVAVAMHDDWLIIYLGYDPDIDSKGDPVTYTNLVERYYGLNCSEPEHVFRNQYEDPTWSCLLYTQVAARLTAENLSTNAGSREVWTQLNQSSPQQVSTVISTCLLDYCTNLESCSSSICTPQNLILNDTSLSIPGIDGCLSAICGAALTDLPNSDILGIGILIAISIQQALITLSFICLIPTQVRAYKLSKRYSRGSSTEEESLKITKIHKLFQMDADAFDLGSALTVRKISFMLVEELLLAGFCLLVGVLIAGLVMAKSIDKAAQIAVTFMLALGVQASNLILYLFRDERSYFRTGILVASCVFCCGSAALQILVLNSSSLVAREIINPLADKCWGYNVEFCRNDEEAVQTVLFMPSAFVLIVGSGLTCARPLKPWYCYCALILTLVSPALVFWRLISLRSFISLDWSFGQIVAVTAILPTLISTVYNSWSGSAQAETSRFSPGPPTGRSDDSLEDPGTAQTTTAGEGTVSHVQNDVKTPDVDIEPGKTIMTPKTTRISNPEPKPSVSINEIRD